jgi:hypothetical protein
MKQDDDPVFTRPAAYGIENLEAPGEPDRAHQAPSTPVPGTGREAREAHQQQHDARGATPRDEIYEHRRDRAERIEDEEDESEAFDAEPDLTS